MGMYLQIIFILAVRNKGFSVTSDFVFDPEGFSDSDDFWILKYCLNLMADTSRFSEKLADLFLNGETGGDIDWGIHRWGELTAIEYEVDEFEGYRAYMGPDEHGQGSDADIEIYVDEDTLKRYLRIVCDWYVSKCPAATEVISDLREKFQIQIVVPNNLDDVANVQRFDRKAITEGFQDHHILSDKIS